MRVAHIITGMALALSICGHGVGQEVPKCAANQHLRNSCIGPADICAEIGTWRCVDNITPEQIAGQTKPIGKPLEGKFQKDVPATLTYSGDGWVSLKCGKYQHVEYGPTCEPGETCIVNDPTHRHWTRSCVDDMHQVTEREWQEMLSTQERLQSALNHLVSALDHQANFNDKIIKALERVKK